MRRLLDAIRSFFVTLTGFKRHKGPRLFEPLCVAHLQGKTHLFALRESDKKLVRIPQGKHGDFSHHKGKVCTLLMGNGKPERIHQCSQFSVSESEGFGYLSYVRKNEKGKKLFVLAKSKDFASWRVVATSGEMSGRSLIIPGYSYHDRAVMVYGDNSIGLATSPDMKSLNVMNHELLSPRMEGFDHTALTPILAQSIDGGILVLYDASYQTYGHQALQIGAALLAHDNPEYIHWRPRADHISVEGPVWQQFIGNGERSYKPLGATLVDNMVHVFFASGHDVFSVAFPQPFAYLHPDEQEGAALHKYEHNPILSPRAELGWESVASFNPAAVYDNGKIHLLYRATGYTGMSVVGYASSTDGYTFNERLTKPVYVPRRDFEGVGIPLRDHTEMYVSGCSWDGCEDARATIIDDRLYLIYAAYNGWEQARLAMTWLPIDDFRKHNWAWSLPDLMSPRARTWGEGNKNSCILPEKINGKYVVFHRIWPHICIDYVDDLEFGENKKWLTIRDQIPIRGAYWDSHKVGMGATPIKTDIGWLVIYQGVGSQDFHSHYKIGAMILDLEDPSRVLYRSKRPILEPSEWYEMEGHKGGVAYACGAVVKDGKLFVYYGAADTVVAVATAPLDEFLRKLKRDAVVDEVLRPVSFV